MSNLYSLLSAHHCFWIDSSWVLTRYSGTLVMIETVILCLLRTVQQVTESQWLIDIDRYEDVMWNLDSSRPWPEPNAVCGNSSRLGPICASRVSRQLFTWLYNAYNFSINSLKFRYLFLSYYRVNGICDSDQMQRSSHTILRDYIHMCMQYAYICTSASTPIASKADIIPMTCWGSHIFSVAVIAIASFVVEWLRS